MSQHAREYGFVELASLPVLVPVLVFTSAALWLWGLSWALGFALGAGGALLGAYFSLLHLRKLFREPPDERRLRRGAASGALAGIAFMAGVLAASVLIPWLDFIAVAAGLLATKLLIGLTPTLRRHDGRDR